MAWVEGWLTAWSIASINVRQPGNSWASMAVPVRRGTRASYQCCPVPAWTGSEPLQEAADRRAVVGNVDQERVVPLRRVQRHEFHRCAGVAQAVGDLLLLLEREQDVGAHADHHRPLDVDALEPLAHAATAVFGHVEPVAGARQVQVAVGVERAHEALGVALQVGLDLELDAEGMIFALLRIEPDAGEAAVP